MASRTRRKFSDAVKLNTVRRIDAGSSVLKEARRLEASPTIVRRWVGDSRFQSPGDTLPTKAAATKRRKAKAGTPKLTEAKPIIVTAQECPHCGGALEVAAA